MIDIRVNTDDNGDHEVFVTVMGMPLLREIVLVEDEERNTLLYLPYLQGKVNNYWGWSYVQDVELFNCELNRWREMIKELE